MLKKAGMISVLVSSIAFGFASSAVGADSSPFPPHTPRFTPHWSSTPAPSPSHSASAPASAVQGPNPSPSVSASSSAGIGTGSPGSSGSSVNPSPSPSVSPVSQKTPIPLSPSVNPRVLLGEFTKAQYFQIKALEHRLSFEIKELKTSQSAQMKDWERKERDARHQYFAEHSRGPDRRAYVQDFISRREKLRKDMATHRTEVQKSQEEQVKALKSKNELKLKDFKKALDQGVTPPAELWP